MDNSSSTLIPSRSFAVQIKNGVQVKAAGSVLQQIKVSSFVFQLALICYCLARCIGLSELTNIGLFSTAIQLLSYISIGLLIFKTLLFSRYSVLEIAIYLILGVIALLSTYYSTESSLIYLVLFLIGAKGIETRNICRIVLPITVIFSIIIILLSITGIIENEVIYSVNNLTGEITARRSFGFSHYNHLGRISLVAFACYIYLRFDKFGVLDIILTLIWSALLYFVVSTKTTPIIMIITAVLILLSKVITYKWFVIICAIIGFIGIVGSISLAYFYDPSNGFIEQINTWSSGRLRSAHYFFDNYPITLFGQYIDFGEAGTSSRLILDNAYVNLLFRYGALSLIAVVAAYVYAFIKSSRNHRLPIIIILTIMFLVGFAETWLFSLPGVIVLALAFGTNSKLKQDGKHYTRSTVNIAKKYIQE